MTAMDEGAPALKTEAAFILSEAGELKPPIVCLRSISQKHW
jgi:hypothetical protein